MGKLKLASVYATTVPRLYLCAKVLGVELCKFILDEIDMDISRVASYTDSKVTLGYITNETRKFYNFAANSIQKIWFSFTPTSINSADHGRFLAQENGESSDSEFWTVARNSALKCK